jgi:hypothetical protein
LKKEPNQRIAIKVGIPLIRGLLPPTSKQVSLEQQSFIQLSWNSQLLASNQNCKLVWISILNNILYQNDLTNPSNLPLNQYLCIKKIIH